MSAEWVYITGQDVGDTMAMLQEPLDRSEIGVGEFTVPVVINPCLPPDIFIVANRNDADLLTTPGIRSYRETP